MKKTVKILTALTLCGSLVLLSGCYSVMEQAGVPQEQIEEFRDTNKEMAQEALDQLNKEIDELNDQMNVLADELGELILGSDEAYQTVAKLYENTRLPGRYDRLAGKAIDGTKIWEMKNPDGGQRLCDMEKLLGGYTKYYGSENPYTEGQCTWYCFGRFWEDNGIRLGDFNNGVQWLDNTDTWVKTVYQKENPDADMSKYSKIDGYRAAGVFVVRGEAKIYPHSIAVCTSSQSAGHVMYIEDVTYENGEPVTVWFSEANWRSDGGKVDDWDGVLMQMSYKDFCSKRSVLGYIVPTYFLH